jgi:hypothetical protein
MDKKIDPHSPSPPSESSDRLREAASRIPCDACGREAASRIPCDACGREVPLSEAVVREASDYVAYFCGLECYERWHSQAERFLAAFVR